MKNESKRQKTCISVTKRVFSVLVAVVVLASLVAVFADNLNPSYTFDDGQPLRVGTSTSFSDYTIGTYYDSNTFYVKLAANKSDIYVFMVGNKFITASLNQTSWTTYYGAYISSGYLASYSNYTGGTLDSSTGVYYSDSNIYYNYNNKYVPVYSSIQEGLSAISGYLNPEPTVSAQTLNVSLPAGNILIADISNTGSNPYYLETTSGTTGAVVKPGMNNIQIGYSNTVPASFTVPNSSWDYPSWSGSGNASVLGTYNRQSTQGDFALSNTNALKYVIITNPMYPNDNNASANRLNSDLSITIEKVNLYVIYSLQTGYVSGNLIGTNDGTQYIDYQYDEDTGEWVGINQDGNPASPVWGGQNDFENTPTTINDWLENIAHQISSFFSGAIGAITTLSVAVKNFAGTLMSLYVWLPSPVLSILSSAVMLAIVIGVIKVFI